MAGVKIGDSHTPSTRPKNGLGTEMTVPDFWWTGRRSGRTCLTKRAEGACVLHQVGGGGGAHGAEALD
jgi:hypothetical protein